MRTCVAALLGLVAAGAAPPAWAERPISDSGWDQAGRPQPKLTAAERRARAERIRDAAAAAGLANGVLLAGIAEVETGLAHCWSEATWACQGPASASCDGGPVIAGSADGPCSAQQGGLGMFQFDAGTYQDTIDVYGPDIVTIEGNVGAVVPFLVERAIQSVEGVSTEAEALAWMNSIPIVDGDPDFETWVYFVSWRYNGCQGCTAQENKYRQGTHTMLAEFGADFWASPGAGEDGCSIPAEGRVLEESDPCAALRGPLQYWRSESAGHGGGLRWTVTTDEPEPSNYALWRLRVAESGRYRLSVYTDGGEFAQSRQAAYLVDFNGGSEVVVIDQRATEGWQTLGVYELAAGAEHTVRLDDNTGEPWAEQPDGVRLAFDALAVEPVSRVGDGGGELLSGGCGAANRGVGGGAAVVLLSILALRRAGRSPLPKRRV